MLASFNHKQLFLAAIGIGLIARSTSLLLRSKEVILISPEDPFCPNCDPRRRARFSAMPQANSHPLPEKTVLTIQEVLAFEAPCPDCWGEL